MKRKHQSTQTTEETDSNVSSQETTGSAMEQHSSNALCMTAGNGEENDVAIPSNSFHFIGRLVGETHLLLISETKAVVGRASPGTNVDFPVADNKLISRHHFRIQYCSNEFSVVCLSKNGVYMGDRFLPKSDTPYKLETSCYFRFPSTGIKVFFDNLIGPTPNVGLLVDWRMMPPSISTLLNNGSIATHSEASVSNNCENMENNTQYHSVCPYVLNTFNKLLGPPPTSIPASGANLEAANAPQQITQSTPSAGPGNSDKGKATVTSKSKSRDRNRPPFSYSQLIVQAIRASPSQQLTLAEIYTYLKETYPYFRTRPSGGWQNSIRHNLSLNRFFIKIPRTTEVAGKGSYWRIDHIIYTKAMATRYQKPNRRSATITYLGGHSGGTFSSAPVSPNRESNTCLAPPMRKQMSMSVPGSPEHSHDDDL